MPRSGSVALNHRAILGMDAVVVSHICALVPKSANFDINFLYYLLCRMDMRKLTKKTTGLDSIAFSDIRQIEIPLPPLEEQQRIAARLDAADRLRALRRDAVAALDALTHSLFLEMFGDPAHNPMNWPMVKLADVGKVSTGNTPPSKLDGMFGGDIPFLTPGDLDKNGAGVKRTLTQEGATKSRTVRAGSTMVCCIGATIGKMDKAAKLSAFNQQINAVEWFDKTDDDYGHYALRFFKEKIAILGASTTLPILKKSSFEKIEIPLPPLSLQREFAARLGQIETVRSRMEDSRVRLDALFASLQSAAFEAG